MTWHWTITNVTTDAEGDELVVTISVLRPDGVTFTDSFEASVDLDPAAYATAVATFLQPTIDAYNAAADAHTVIGETGTI